MQKIFAAEDSGVHLAIFKWEITVQERSAEHNETNTLIIDTENGADTSKCRPCYIAPRDRQTMHSECLLGGCCFKLGSSAATS